MSPFHNLAKLFNLCNISLASFLKALIPLAVIVSIIDFVSISLLVPVISMLSGLRTDFVSDERYFLPLLGGLFLSFIMLKVLVLPLLVKLYMSHVLAMRRKLSVSLIRYLSIRQSLDQAGFSAIVHSGINEVNIVINRIVIPCIDLLIEVVVVLLIFAGMFYLDPLIASIASVLSLFAVWLIIKMTFSKLGQAGAGRAHWERMRIRRAKDYFFLFWPAKLMNKNDFFLEKYEFATESSNSANLKMHTFRALSKSLIEAIFLCAVLVGIGYVFMHDPKISVAGSFGIVAVIRILPSINRLIYSGQSVKFGYQTLLNLAGLESKTIPEAYLDKTDNHDEVSGISLFASNNENQSKSMQLETVKLNVSNGSDILFKDINLKTPISGLTLVRGPSGIGKSSFLKALTGRFEDGLGDVYYRVKADQQPLHISKAVTFVEQDTYLFEGTLIENVAFSNDVDMARLIQCLKAALVDRFIALENISEVMVSDLGENFSGGEKARICVARALYQRCPIIIFDETLSSISEQDAILIMQNSLNLSWVSGVVVVFHSFINTKIFERTISLGEGIKIS